MCDSIVKEVREKERAFLKKDVENLTIPDKLIPTLPTTEGKKCDKCICFVELLFSHINDLLMQKKFITHPVKFSVHHVIQHIFNFSDTPDNRLKIKAEFPISFDVTELMSYLASGSGPVLYEDDPTEITIESLIKNNDAYTNKQFRVPYIIGTIGNSVCNDEVYKRVKEILAICPSLIGGIVISPDGLDKDKKSYYHNIVFVFSDEREQSYSHCIKVIGYDDNYSKDNFNYKGRKPREDGAVLAEINCVEGISHLWISYETVGYVIFIYIRDISLNTNIYNVYEYDIIGKNNWINTPEKMDYKTERSRCYVLHTVSMKNVFKTRNPGKEYLEYIKFALYDPYDPEITVMDGDEIVYHYLSSEYDVRKSNFPNSEHYFINGYYSYKLDKPVLITAESFSIKITLFGLRPPVATDGVKHNTPNICYINEKDIIEEREGMYDFQNRFEGHCCIKALTITKE